jgi:hypothetical protein
MLASVAGAKALRDGQDIPRAADDVTSFNGFTHSQNSETVTIVEAQWGDLLWHQRYRLRVRASKSNGQRDSDSDSSNFRHLEGSLFF